MTELIINDEPTESLKERLSGLLARTASDLVEMASIVSELDRRGEDLSGLRIGLTGYLRRIAAGTLAPEAVVRFASAPRLLDAVSTLPLTEQQRLASGEPVELAVWHGDTVDSRRFDPLSLTTLQQRQVFGDGRIRSVEDQIPLLTHTQTLTRSRQPKRLGKVRADKSRGVLLINRTEVSPGEILSALAELGDPTPPASDGDELSTVAVKLTAEQHRRLKVYAAKYSASIGEIIIQSLAGTGVFRNPM